MGLVGGYVRVDTSMPARMMPLDVRDRNMLAPPPAAEAYICCCSHDASVTVPARACGYLKSYLRARMPANVMSVPACERPCVGWQPACMNKKVCARAHGVAWMIMCARVRDCAWDRTCKRACLMCKRQCAHACGVQACFRLASRLRTCVSGSMHAYMNACAHVCLRANRIGRVRQSVCPLVRMRVHSCADACVRACALAWILCLWARRFVRWCVGA